MRGLNNKLIRNYHTVAAIILMSLISVILIICVKGKHYSDSPVSKEGFYFLLLNYPKYFEELFELFKKQFIFETAFHLAFSFFIEFSITKIFINTKHCQLIDNFIQCLTFFGQYIFNITFISV